MLDALFHSPHAFDTPERLTDVSSWHGHLPFALFSISFFKPRVFVELGTHKGDSYCAFCQAVKTLDLPTRCFAVDTWQGDAQSGHYGPGVFDELAQYNTVRYADFSELLRMTFDEALHRFADGTVDLLHIDGLHTYAAVRHDFDAWLPKMSPAGVVLLHDTHVTQDDFGVWRLWKELSERYPSFCFQHSSGLGVLAVGQHQPPGTEILFHLSPPAAQWVRHLFRCLGERVTLCRRTEELKNRLHAVDWELGTTRTYARDLEERVEEIAANDARRGRYIQGLEERLDHLAGLYEERGRWIEVLEQRLAEPLSARLMRMARADIARLRARLRGAV
ncbi:class I SAM-dependent methyltransferase [Desulfatitalea alkaliphila]|uniref:Class I SAM-dependent methyltransferase n=1 Tax=Desulfatitalea alkaliphila TaxID=2929485 RepID=A0AA41UI99_9BACT|nr:class I SAM-dependent methyltransferase [Desulfatitalea alkaliphila]MCJ8499392.1 class I SAM-dependent methyltransferase [Desulfatitalea alkaliphila]